ncbi:adenylate/guanylate cyclase domain-containing protein [Skermanella pratensis]|uniref:adenylate/guanylate cyclase domain-containing protein n=1 Tax=Skermanella pratensis TaxID=2233999 RepID=UPI0017883F1D|nr:adenylate/guanylate cyclase domain-containing protein [Skermanella pratensis]
MLDRQAAMVAVTLGGYAVVGLLAWSVTGSGRFRPWMSWVFVTLDVGFILASVAVAILNTGIEADYLAGFPAVWLSPLVLAFGALRYNPILQAYVTALLAAGLAAAAATSGTPVSVTRIGVPEQLGLFFSVPPNIMRLVMLVAAGAVLALAAARARSLLRQAVEETRRRANLTRYLPPQIAARLAETGSDEARRGRHQPVAVLFTDIRGFTLRAESMDPVELGRFVGEFRARVSAAVAAHGGVIDKFIGDAVMVLFGVPDPGPRDAAAALSAARAILAEIGDWNRERLAAGRDAVAVGVGVHWGEVFCGAIGDDARLEFTVLGDTVNVAARLEETCKTAGLPLVASRQVIDAAGESPEACGWKRLEPARLRGRLQSIELYGADPR